MLFVMGQSLLLGTKPTPIDPCWDWSSTDVAGLTRERRKQGTVEQWGESMCFESVSVLFLSSVFEGLKSNKAKEAYRNVHWGTTVRLARTPLTGRRALAHLFG